MSKRRFPSLSLPIATLVAAGIACGGGDSTPITQLNLDRPVDIAFACVGAVRITNGAPATADQPVQFGGMPTAACDIRSGKHDTGTPAPVPAGQEDLTAQGGSPLGDATWYGFILQSATGTVALSSFPTKPSSAFGGGDVLVLDADPLTPGKNAISVGEDPIAITMDKSGCYALTANAGSCDMSGLEVSTAVDLAPDVHVDRYEVLDGAGAPLRAKPAAMVADNTGGLIGAGCGAKPTGIVYVAYPSCHLVAAVDTATSTVVGGVKFDAAGVATLVTGGNVTCDDECGGATTITDGPRPVTLDLEVGASGSHRLAIGADNSNKLTIVEIDPATSLPMSASPVVLEPGAVPAGQSFGVTDIAISPEIGMGGSAGILNDATAPGGQFQFVYAITTDNTVRVADILTLGKECDTQVDPRLLQNERNVRKLSCLVVGDPTTPARRPGAKGPGIELTAGAIPTSIDVVRSPETDPDTRTRGPTKLVGYFGVISAANGAVFVLNVDDDDYPDFESDTDPLAVEITSAIPHQLRDSVPARNFKAETPVDMDHPVAMHICNTSGPDPDSAAGVSAGPRATTPPTRSIATSVIATERIAALPSIRQVKCESTVDGPRAVSELNFAAPDDVRDLEFPDLQALRSDEIWSLTYEGVLSADAGGNDVDGPPIRTSQLSVDSTGLHLIAQDRPFCDAGVEEFDTVQLRGCDPSFGDNDCPLGYTCYVHPNSQVVGLGSCMLADEADRLANACKDFLTTTRRYTVGRAESGELKLLARKHVLRTTPLDGCASDDQCVTAANYEASLLSTANPIDTTITDKHTYSCMVDPDRAPLDGPGQTGKRCVQTCSDTQACSVGAVCQAGICMDSVVPPQACVNAPQRYELRSSEAFTVIGSRSGYVHPIVADANGRCVVSPTAHPFLQGRIPLEAPPCDPTADPRTGRRPDGTFGPNPCSLTVDQTENAPNYVPGTCTLADPTSQLITRQAPAIQFRNRGMKLTLVDPYASGDQMCIGDRAGTTLPPKTPLVFKDYTLAWRLAAGFSPEILQIAPALPVKVVRGPLDSIWVIDDGDFLSTSATQASTRGKVYRIEPQTLVVNLLE